MTDDGGKEIKSADTSGRHQPSPKD
jgi:hypothetical protein